MPKLAAVVITLNEAAHIEACLESVVWADERLVVDSGSTDDTVERARGAGATVTVREWPGYAAQKNWAAGQTGCDWILSLDADERVSPALADEIRHVLAQPPSAAGFRMPRVTWHLGRWIRTTDWYPDYQLRLYDRRRARWTPARVHESVKADGAVGRLTGEIQHYAYRDISHHHQTMDRYTTLAAAEMFDRGRRAGLPDLLLHPPAAFLRNYVLRRGFLDGATGLIVSAMNAHYVFLKFAKLRAMQMPRVPER
ncbi:MAG: glycosyltransferase family 2 protein [Acidobacteria bacterium]|nr:glycosyltransferase family 2 protein [Acidobacteriota bacterium]